MNPSTLPLYNQTGKKISELSLDRELLDGEVNEPLLHQVVRKIQASRRRGTHSTKTKSDVSGGGVKPWRQKGTGRARAGSIRSPLWRHGGVTFGPHPRDYAYALSKKIKRLALRSSLNAKVRDGEIILIDYLEITEPKTKHLAAILASLGIQKKVLVVVEKVGRALRLAHRNLPGVVLLPCQSVNAYDLLCVPKVVMEQAAFTELLKRCAEERSR